VWPVLTNGFQDLIERQILLPLLAVAGVVTGSRAIQAQETRKPVRIQFALKDLKDVPFELFVR
jgi:hypothetical protein